MIDPSSEILAAFYAVLNGNLSYASEDWPVYDSVPKAETSKFVVMEELSVGDDITKDKISWDCLLTFEIVGEIATNRVSMKPVNSITGQILNAIFKVNLPMISFTMSVLPWIEDVSKFDDIVGSGILARKAIRVRFGVQQVVPYGLLNFDGVNDFVTLDAVETNIYGSKTINFNCVIFSGQNFNTGFQVLIQLSKADTSDAVVVQLKADGGGVDPYMQVNANTTNNIFIPLAGLFDTVLKVEIIKTAGALTSVKVNGKSYTGTKLSTLATVAGKYFGSLLGAGGFFKGLLWDFAIDGVVYWKGYPVGNTDAAWEDQVNSNDGTVNGAPAIWP